MTTAVRVLALLEGGVALGMTLLIAVLYQQAWRYLKPRPLVLARHVAYIGTAHMLLILALMVTILLRVQGHDPFSWWVTPLSITGFSLTILALVQLLRSNRLREIHAEVSAHVHL